MSECARVSPCSYRRGTHASRCQSDSEHPSPAASWGRRGTGRRGCAETARCCGRGPRGIRRRRSSAGVTFGRDTEGFVREGERTDVARGGEGASRAILSRGCRVWPGSVCVRWRLFSLFVPRRCPPRVRVHLPRRRARRWRMRHRRDDDVVRRRPKPP